jgi:two-component system, NarL family, nitrate/nitrite sensor histidine kinase NarX
MNAALDSVDLPVTAVAAPPLPVLDIFAEITAGLTHGKQLETLLKQFLTPIVHLAGAQAGLVRMLSDDGVHMRMVGEIGLPEEVRLAEQSVDRNCGTCGVAADSDSLTWAIDLKPCAKHIPGSVYFERQCKRMLAVPLRHRERLLGLYNLYFETDAELGPDVLSMLRSIGELLGLALHNAWLERENLRATVMNERKFLASEVHDTIAQTLVYVNMRLPLLHDAMLQHDDELSLKYFSDVEQAVGSVHANLREILTNFRACMDPRGLLHALGCIADEFTKRSGIALEYTCEPSDLGLSVDQEVQVFHIVQEALANISRHSQARQARLTVQRGARQLEILVEDDGRGLSDSLNLQQVHSASGQSHFGLDIMKERAQRLGARVEIGARPEGGTQVRLSIAQPVPDSQGRAS